MEKGYIVEIDKGVWLAPISGDPGRTLVKTYARVYKSVRGAKIALGMARRYRPFENGIIYEVNSN
jgi:hypothetical protein